ncbi:carbon storage regulator [Alteribacillus persepolensis]|uniref:carbon storage regulator n=1 Tax=Alteribacillus persepolensis TaxID=568899 RepID=UPI000B836BD6|nr:carbon storage regulator [Alteribacillus persepolensis]
MTGLVVGRQSGESIIIGNNIKITMLEQDKEKDIFRLKIEAPKDIPVLREEIYEDYNK